MKKILIVTDPKKEHYTEDSYNTLLQVYDINDSLKSLGYSTEVIYFDLDLNNFINKIKDNKPDIIFNMVEDENYIYYPPIIFENLGIKYTGADSSLMLLTNNKIKIKKFLQNRNFTFKIPKYLSLYENTFTSNLITAIIKPVTRHGSYSIDSNSVIRNKKVSDVLNILKIKQKEKKIEFFAEEFIEGREFNIGYLNNIFLPLAEITFQNYKNNQPKIVDYNAKWISDSFEYKATIREFNFDNKNNISEKLKLAATELVNFLHIKTFFRFDFRVDYNGDPYLIDINLNPCLLNIDGFYSACKEKNISYNQMIEMILNEVYY